jgi:hypothetical protein
MMLDTLFSGKARSEEGDGYREWAIAVAEHAGNAGTAGLLDLDGM